MDPYRTDGIEHAIIDQGPAPEGFKLLSPIEVAEESIGRWMLDRRTEGLPPRKRVVMSVELFWQIARRLGAKVEFENPIDDLGYSGQRIKLATPGGLIDLVVDATLPKFELRAE